MAEEIAIIIKAFDEFSKTNEKILGELDKLNQKVSGLSKGQEIAAKAAEQSAKAFDKNLGSLIALGNAASAVEHIQSSLVNLQLRLENATERVANAQDRLADSQTKLSRLQKSGTATADQLHDAEQELERATRGLTISQNNLERTQNMVVGTYISIGVQVLSLIKSLPVLNTQVKLLTASLVGMEIGLVPILAIGAAIVALKLASDNYHERQKTIGTETENLKQLNIQLGDSYGYIKSAQDEFFGRLSEGLDEAARTEINALNAEKALLTGQQSWKSRKEYDATQESIEMIDREISRVKIAAEERKAINVAQVADETNQSSLIGYLLKAPIQEYVDYINSPEVKTAIQLSADWRVQQTKDEVDRTIAELDRLKRKQGEINFGQKPGLGTLFTGKNKNVGNVSNASLMSRELSKELGKKTSI